MRDPRIDPARGDILRLNLARVDVVEVHRGGAGVVVYDIGAFRPVLELAAWRALMADATVEYAGGSDG